MSQSSEPDEFGQVNAGGNDVNSREVDPVSELIEAGAGRRRIAAELGVSEHQARVLLAERRNGHGVGDRVSE